jgi:Fic family protein
MVTLKKKIVDGRVYYYLNHSYRKNGKVNKKEKYIGKKIPKNIEKLKMSFLDELYQELWYPIFDEIQIKYSQELHKMPTSAREKELESFSILFTYDTQRIEGSTLTLRETADLLERNVSPGGKSLLDVKEAEAHKKLFLEIQEYKKDLTFHTILYWHNKLFDQTKPDIAGKLRQHQVRISGSKFKPPIPVEVYPLLMELFRWYNRNKSKLNPVMLAGLVHQKFVTIHPFADGNGRVGRLMMNFVLHKFKYPMLNIPYAKRTSYYNALERSQLKQDENIFVQWIFRRYVKENDRFL